MTFKLFDTIDERFQKVRWLGSAIVLGFAAIASCVIYYFHGVVDKAYEVVYVLQNGQALKAVATDRDQNVAVELKDHLRTFHHYFFDLDPNEKAIEASVNQSYYLVDGTARALYNDQCEKGYIRGLISGNISVRVVLDSISLDLRSVPYSFRCFGTQTLTRTTSVTTRSIVTSGYARSINRADNNPHGFIIERFAVEKNEDIKTVNR